MREPKTAAVECPKCGPVAAKVLGYQVDSSDELADPQATVLAECPECGRALVAQQWYFDEAWSPTEGTIGSWTKFKRVWPNPDIVIPWELPDPVRDSLLEAQKCLRAKAYIAAAAMSGRALEALCRDRNANKSMLATGLKELRAAGEIDERLYDWGVALNEKRNIAAHPDPTPISEQDARYVFEFVLAICDYVYVLTAKFERFKAGE